MLVEKSRVSMLCDQLRLSPYQSYVLESNSKKYDLGKLIKRGGVLYAPYAHDDRGSIADFTARLLFGPRADMIGTDRLLVHNQRRVRIYPTGFFSAYRNGLKYYADAFGRQISHGFFYPV